jgi:uncharacterized protein YegP (UPF0339 family)
VATFYVYRDKANQYRWRLQANNNKIVADSAEGYLNKADCLTGIEIVKREAPTAPIKDQA